jgi:hypothetical protein
MGRLKAEWAELAAANTVALDADESVLLGWLAEGKSTPEIAKLEGTHRSNIWRRAQKLKAKLFEGRGAMSPLPLR